MKKVSVFLVAILTIISLIGCGNGNNNNNATDNATNNASEQANGIIVYGTEDQVTKADETVKNDLESSQVYDIKMATLNGQKVLVMSNTTAKELQGKGLFLTVKDNDVTEAITDFPEVTPQQGVIFAKEEIKDITIDNQMIPATYKGNTIIGSADGYADAFLIVDDAEYANIKGTPEKMSVFLFKDAKQSEKAMSSLKDVNAQHVTIKK
ncbi:MAG: lipoprotein BA_5634 family protein [Bacillaceae bacterium]